MISYNCISIKNNIAQTGLSIIILIFLVPKSIMGPGLCAYCALWKSPPRFKPKAGKVSKAAEKRQKVMPWALCCAS